MLTVALRLNEGETKTGWASDQFSCSVRTAPDTIEVTIPTTRTATTAYLEASRRATMYTTVVMAISPGAVAASANPDRTKRASTPASKPLTNGTGIRCMNRSNTPENPTAAISTPLTMKAPMA